MRKKLMVAGCSFSAVSQSLPGTSWSEVLAKKLDWDLVNLARQGCSNGGIRVQIEEIRRQRPDFAVVSPTFWDRMEIPASAAPYIPPTDENKGWNSDLQQHLQDRTLKNGYDPEAGIDNVNYGNNNYNMICETIFSLAENYPHPYRSGKISKDAQRAVQLYIDSMYDSNWKKQQDEWIIREGILQMYLDGLNFLVLPNLVDFENWTFVGSLAYCIACFSFACFSASTSSWYLDGSNLSNFNSKFVERPELFFIKNLKDLGSLILTVAKSISFKCCSGGIDKVIELIKLCLSLGLYNDGGKLPCFELTCKDSSCKI